MDLSRFTGPAIIAGILAGLFFPFFKVLSPLITIFMGIVIFSSCLNIRIENIVENVRKPGKLGALLFILFILQPILTWLVAVQFVQNTAILAGIILIAAAPAPAVDTVSAGQ